MNIKQAKEEITNTIRAYLSRDSLGNYMIPSIRQRPVLLMGPPGVGKTQIMEQIASETGIGLVAYTITHHTRQSAIGLPFIEHRTYGGEDVTVTEYTMSEILASVYSLMEKTGLKEGILFLDEINCVSETLAPMMLQFLQCKTFGNQKLPEGWIIIAAGNPPEYNKSVRDFDVVTLDRVKRINIEADFGVWKEYASRKGLHGAVVSYLDINKDHFFRVESTVDGPQFATARGWEDLSELMVAYEKLDLRVTREVIEEYIQMPVIARDFANYLELYYKYQKTYHVEDILTGTWKNVTLLELQAAPFDERIAVMSLILSRLRESSRTARLEDELTVSLHEALLEVRDREQEGTSCTDTLAEITERERAALKRASDAGNADIETRNARLRLIYALEDFHSHLQTEGIPEKEQMESLRGRFSEQVERRQQCADRAASEFDNAFSFLEKAFGDSQEMVLFVTEITASQDMSWYVENFGCDAYFRHNKDLLFDDTRQSLNRDILEAKQAIRQQEQQDADEAELLASLIRQNESETPSEPKD